MKPYTQGYDAYVAGVPSTANPFRDQSFDWFDWRDGWLAAKQDAYRF